MKMATSSAAVGAYKAAGTCRTHARRRLGGILIQRVRLKLAPVRQGKIAARKVAARRIVRNAVRRAMASVAVLPAAIARKANVMATVRAPKRIGAPVLRAATDRSRHAIANAVARHATVIVRALRRRAVTIAAVPPSAATAPQAVTSSGRIVVANARVIPSSPRPSPGIIAARLTAPVARRRPAHHALTVAIAHLLVAVRKAAAQTHAVPMAARPTAGTPPAIAPVAATVRVRHRKAAASRNNGCRLVSSKSCDPPNWVSLHPLMPFASGGEGVSGRLGRGACWQRHLHI